MPKARHLWVTSLPMLPQPPMRPTVLPFNPLQFENSPLFHFPAFKVITLSAILLSIEHMWAITSSATATLKNKNGKHKNILTNFQITEEN